MNTEFLIRQKDFDSPEKVNGESGTVDSPERIIENLKRFSTDKENMFDFLMGIEKIDLETFLNHLNKIFNSNVAIDIEQFKINRLRKAVYNSGHILEEGKGLASLEKLGFLFIQEKDKTFLIGNHHTPTPAFLTDTDFFESVSVLFKYLSDFAINDSYMWSFSDKMHYAVVKKDGKVLMDHAPVFLKVIE